MQQRSTQLNRASVLDAWENQVNQAQNNPQLRQQITVLGAALLPRFAAHYRRLQALSRHTRRALQRKWKQSLSGIALLLALNPAQAATINVDEVTCTLVDAITAANTDSPVNGCNAGNGADTIVLQPN